MCVGGGGGTAAAQYKRKQNAARCTASGHLSEPLRAKPDVCDCGSHVPYLRESCAFAAGNFLARLCRGK